MKPQQLTVFVRYALLLLSGMAARGGWLPPELASIAAHDPALIEMIVAGLTGIGTLIWYQFSQSKKALVEKVAAP